MKNTKIFLLTAFLLFTSLQVSAETVKFSNAECEVYSGGYSCRGSLSDSDKLQLEEIQKTLGPKPVIRNVLTFENASCSIFEGGGYLCSSGYMSENDKIKLEQEAAKYK